MLSTARHSLTAVGPLRTKSINGRKDRTVPFTGEEWVTATRQSLLSYEHGANTLKLRPQTIGAVLAETAWGGRKKRFARRPARWVCCPLRRALRLPRRTRLSRAAGRRVVAWFRQRLLYMPCCLGLHPVSMRFRLRQSETARICWQKCTHSCRRKQRTCEEITIY